MNSVLVFGYRLCWNVEISDPPVKTEMISIHDPILSSVFLLSLSLALTSPNTTSFSSHRRGTSPFAPPPITPPYPHSSLSLCCFVKPPVTGETLLFTHIYDQWPFLNLTLSLVFVAPVLFPYRSKYSLYFIYISISLISSYVSFIIASFRFLIPLISN